MELPNQPLLLTNIRLIDQKHKSKQKKPKESQKRIKIEILDRCCGNSTISFDQTCCQKIVSTLSLLRTLNLTTRKLVFITYILTFSYLQNKVCHFGKKSYTDVFMHRYFKKLESVFKLQKNRILCIRYLTSPQLIRFTTFQMEIAAGAWPMRGIISMRCAATMFST